MVRAVFVVHEKGERYNAGYDAITSKYFNATYLKLHPVKGGPFGNATPSGCLEMIITNEEAAKQFEVGKEYFVDFTEAYVEAVVPITEK